ncbi:unnamed protein product [Orchesella dallaii]|uniref:Uncharacterized protein n=1 Tax=Orchesella dallaii TaxID=48710 RepID=A0ABP1Q2Y3_9HEXA
MPKRKKVVEVKVEVPDDYEATQIKAECDSQEVKGTPENDGNPFSRNLRPRKTKCYAEKESPDLEERRVSKVPRRKRRIGSTASENAPETDLEVIDQNKVEVETQRKVQEKPPVQVKPAEQPRPEQKKTILDAVNLPFRDIRLELENLQFPIPSAGPTLSLASKLFSSSNTRKAVAEIKHNHARKRPKKVLLERKIKTEPLEVLATNNEDNSETNPAHGAPNLSTNDNDNNVVASTAPKPKPKRKRKKPQPMSSDKQTEENQNEQVVIKVEAEIKVDNDDDQGCDNAEGECKTTHPDVTKKPASRSKSKGKSETSTSAEESKPDETVVKETDSIDEANQEKKPANAAISKRPKNRPKLLPIAPNTATSAPSAPTNVIDEQSKIDDDIRDLDADEDTSFPARRAFPRGRKSKLLSSRTGRKEVIHTDEAIDPEDIRGFEHVERYVPPAGSRLPKFWDSEDEVSDDENNDNFRRIMCGFGTNCRIHEVIRPASEIVRRLKELQNTFGGTRTLPLFHHGSNEPSDVNHENSDADAGGSGKKMPILWHNDPVYFKYANNFP